jgi:mannosyl-3-phosphoglycerate phosphatase family protein
VSLANAPRHLVFTDLDGTLLDHHDYSFGPAVDCLRRLEELGIPLIIASSKTRAEIEPLRNELGNQHPFICENGAAVFVPENYFPAQPAGTVTRDGWWIREFCEPRATWLALLEELAGEFPGDFTSFYRAGNEGIGAMTGLDHAAACRANQRDYSEPVQWLGSQEHRAEFLQRLRDAGANVLQGGRFLAVAGDCDKGRALVWLRGIYAGLGGVAINDLAAGDSGNDIAMLRAAGMALLVRSPVHDFPLVARDQGVLRSNLPGPAGWSEGVTEWLRQQGLQEEIF